MGISPAFDAGRWFARLDLGVDWNFDAATRHRPAFHHDAGIGFHVGVLAVMPESENMMIGTIGSRDGSLPAAEVMLNALAISARAETSSVSPCLAVMFPVEEDISREVTWGATLGIDVKLP